MQLPNNLAKKINSIFSESKDVNLKKSRENLTDKYKNKTGTSSSLIETRDDSLVYAVTRMPATYSVIYSLFCELLSEGLITNVESILDVGSGTGSGYFAIKQLSSDYNLSDYNFIFSDEKYRLYENNILMIDIFNELSESKKVLEQQNILTAYFQRSDLIFSSFVLSELNKFDRVAVFQKMLDASSHYVLVIDTGTPETYYNTYSLKSLAEKSGYRVIAPCMGNCTLSNDYCQFYARVERSSLLRQAKSASLPYEDEKYFYMLFEKVEKYYERRNVNLNNTFTRVIRRPVIKGKEVSLVLCTNNGVVSKVVRKSDKNQFKIAKKIKINQLF